MSNQFSSSQIKLEDMAQWRPGIATRYFEEPAACTMLKYDSSPYNVELSNSALFQNFPNPFNPETWIPYELAKEAEVVIKIDNVKGALVRTLSI